VGEALPFGSDYGDYFLMSVCGIAALLRLSMFFLPGSESRNNLIL
jgi:hypothetical protein